MDGQPATAESKHHYQPRPWPSDTSGSTTPRVTATSPAESSPSYLTPQLDLLSVLFPQQRLYQDKLLQYNKLLVSAGRGNGGGLQTPPLPPVLSSPQTTFTTRSRSSSKVSNKDNTHTKPGAQSCHGNRAARPSETAERALIKSGKEPSTKMSSSKPSGQPTAREAPTRLPPSSYNAHFPTAQSNSVPTTPHHHPRTFSFESREPSPNANQDHSPRSAYSETNGNVPSLRPLPPRLGGCRFETAIPHSRRRMPYSLGTDRLEQVDPSKIKSRLSEEDERTLEIDMRKLFDNLIPTDAIEMKRRALVNKSERLFNEEWPGHDIQVHLFGSSGNMLCSDDSDVDICITTPWRELESVCLIAELLDRHGMEKIVCVSSAKVPIVKIWDPELNLAGDMNVNNTLALENTRMMRTYVSIDDRVRPLAMIIKYWTRRRIINDAAFGGTLSSYTWICMVIAFLQLRDPPVLPALHTRHNLKLLKKDGTRSDFADDISKLRGFGAKNKESLASLLFHFFRFYAHEFDYDKSVLSIRLGRVLTKTEKKWHIGSNNAFCIEEPFNTIRNLGNTADDTSFRGLHMELRRAFELLAEGKLEECCDEYVFPKEEERIWQKPTPAPRPAVLLRSSSSSHQQGGRGGRGSFRGNRQFNRNANASRRASTAVAYETSPAFAQAGMPNTMSPQDLLWYQAQNPQLSVSQELLASSINALAAQETMRFQLYTQINQQQALAHAQRLQTVSATDRSRTNSFDNPPLTAPIRPELMYGFGFPMQHSPYFHPGFTTYPSSPATAAAAANGQAEFRRSLHRNTAASDSAISPGSGALRSQSQPASRTSMAAQQQMQGYSASSPSQNGVAVFQPRQTNGVSMPAFVPDEAGNTESNVTAAKILSESPAEDDTPRYIGYYVNDHSSSMQQTNGFASDASQSRHERRRRLSTDQLPQSVLDRRMKRTSRSPSPHGHARALSVGMNPPPLLSTPFAQTNGTRSSKPLVVNGTVPKTTSTTPGSSRAPAVEPVAPNGISHDNGLYIHQGWSPSSSWPEHLPHHLSGVESAVPSAPDRPVIANGSSTNRSPSGMQNLVDAASFQQRMAMGTGFQLPYPAPAGDPNGFGGFSRIHTRQQLAPLDLATGDYAVHQELPHLSPVYEHRTPSPTAARKFEPLSGAKSPSHHPMRESRSEFSKPGLRSPIAKLPTVKSPTVKSPTAKSPTVKSPRRHNDTTTRSPAQDQRANGFARENGHVRAAKSQTESTGSWQKSKQRKKAVSDMKHPSKGAGQGEQLPKNETDRKGG